MASNGTIKEDGNGLFVFGKSQHQREYPHDHVHKGQDPYHEGKVHSHNRLDSKDQRSIANKLAAEEHRTDPTDSKEVEELKRDPTLPARMHGNKPSRGAVIDEQIQEEEKAELEKKDARKEVLEHNKHHAHHKHAQHE